MGHHPLNSSGEASLVDEIFVGLLVYLGYSRIFKDSEPHMGESSKGQTRIRVTSAPESSFISFRKRQPRRRWGWGGLCLAPVVSEGMCQVWRIFPGENFLNFRQDCQEEARQGVDHVEDVFDTIGSGKFKVPFPLGSLGRNVKI